jgi:cytoskeleton protein RodZ
MDEETVEPGITVGQRLKEAREAKGLSLEDIAASTRIPRRHLESLEASEWDKLPAPTYSVGFARNYAVALGLDRTEIGDALKLEMGGYQRATRQVEVYETVDPARTIPKGLVFGVIAGLVVAVLLFTWVSAQSTTPDEPVAENAATAPDTGLTVPAPAPAATAQGLVVLTASQPVWIEVKDGAAVLKQGELAVGERYEVPTNAAAPQLTTGKPEALTITVGQTQAPAVGAAGVRVANVSLRGADLLRGPVVPVAAEPTRAPARPATRSAPRPAAPVTPAQQPASEPANAAAPAP